MSRSYKHRNFEYRGYIKPRKRKPLPSIHICNGASSEDYIDTDDFVVSRQRGRYKRLQQMPIVVGFLRKYRTIPRKCRRPQPQVRVWMVLSSNDEGIHGATPNDVDE